MSFRGINTTVIQIRRQVFTEVARMAYANVKGEQANHLMRKIPYTIIPGEEGKLRKDIFLERAIVEERVRLAMGLPTRRMDEHNSVVSGLEDASIADKYYDPPLVNVIKFACNRCPEKLVKVSDLCQGCLAHPCMEVCPKKAITWESGRSIIDQDKCIKCGKCFSQCLSGYFCIAVEVFCFAGYFRLIFFLFIRFFYDQLVVRDGWHIIYHGYTFEAGRKANFCRQHIVDG